MVYVNEYVSSHSSPLKQMFKDVETTDLNKDRVSFKSYL